MALSAEEDEDYYERSYDSVDPILKPPKKAKPLYVNPLSKIPDYIIEKTGIQELRYVFEGIKLGCNILLWALQGFLTPGAIMMLGLFVLGLSAFKTQLATDLFLGASIAYAVGNVFCNIYTTIKQKRFDQVDSDTKLIQHLIGDLDRYLLSREVTNAAEDGYDTVDIMTHLEGNADDVARRRFENNLYFSTRALYNTVYDSVQRAKKYCDSPFLRFLTRVTLAIESTAKTLGFGFGMFIFCMMTLNIFWTFPLWLIGLVFGAGIVSGTIVFLNALDNVNVFVNDQNAIDTLDEQLELLRGKAETIAAIAPHVLKQNNEDFAESANSKKHPELQQVDLEVLHGDPAVYKPLYVSLEDIAVRVNKDKNGLTEFLEDSSPYDYASDQRPR